jgi:hypothetical protein
MKVPGKLSTVPFHVVGLILFFISHGYAENIGLIPLPDLLLCFAGFTAIAVLICYLFYLSLRSWIKAGLVTTFFVLFMLFFGVLQDYLRSNSFLNRFSGYKVLLPLFVVCLVAFWIFLKRSKRSFNKLNLFVNTLIICFVLLDVAVIAMHSTGQKTKAAQPTTGIADCKDCKKPDIYLVLLDEYAGSQTLRKEFDYDNSGFENFLRTNKFHVAATPNSNYSVTPISMASFFDMNYVYWMGDRREIFAQDYTIAADLMSKSTAYKTLQAMGYKFVNHSIFDIAGQPSKFNTGLLPFQLKLITSKTLYSRMNKDLFWDIRSKIAPNFKWIGNVFQLDFKEGNSMLMELTRQELKKGVEVRPKFVYTHLMMPHAPYSYDSVGRETKNDSTLIGEAQEDAYLQYLVYTNKKIASFVQEIMDATRGEAVVMLMSDHGFRAAPGSRPINPNNNFNAVYLPSGDYSRFYDSITNVNQLRAFFNTQFNQQLPLLKDSIAF